MLKERLLSKDFYLENLSMFMKDSYGIKERLYGYISILNNINDIADGLVSRFDLYNLTSEIDYFTRNNIDPDGTEDAILDMLADIFGIERTLEVTYPGDGGTVTEIITLNNRDLYIYILVSISKLNYQGTNKEIRDLYSSDTIIGQVTGIKYVWGSASLSCDVYFCGSEELEKWQDGYNSNLVKLFLSDKLLIESLGIQYSKHLGMFTFPIRFDTEYTGEYEYTFDPDYSHQNEPGFRYGVFT